MSSPRTFLSRMFAPWYRKAGLGVIVLATFAIVRPNLLPSDEKHVSSLDELPSDDHYIADYTGKDFNIVGIERHSRFVWDLPAITTEGLEPQNARRRLAWIPETRKLFFATRKSADFVLATGSQVRLELQMPGQLKPLDGMQTYAVNSDGRYVAYNLYTRDSGDRQSDGFGRLYRDVMFQNTDGSTPPTSVLSDTISLGISWSPEGDRLAIGDSSGLLTVVNLKAKILQTVQLRSGFTIAGSPMDLIEDVQWQPHGQLIALIDKKQIYVVNANGSGLHKVEFPSPVRAVTSFTWSPDGQRLAIRGVTGVSCHFALRTDTFEECTVRSSIFTSNLDGSFVKKVKGTDTAVTSSQYRGTSLFWLN